MNSKRSAGEAPRLDPALKQAVLRWEEQAAEAWTGMLRDPHFLRHMWRMVENSFQTRQLLEEQLARHAATLQLPTRANQERLDEALARLETELSRLEQKVDELLERDPS